MKTELLKLYAQCRAHKPFMLVGQDAACSLNSARTILRFRELEKEGLVRLRSEPEMENYFDVYGDPEGYTNAQGHYVDAEKARTEIEDQIESMGCDWVVAEYLDENGDWEHADSIGMCIYNDPLSPFENCYVVGLMDSAITDCAIVTRNPSNTMNTATESTLAKLIDSTNIPASLVRAVVRQLGGWESFKESAPDIARHGIDGGFSGFVYYSDTEPFARRNIESINELASSQAQEIGYDSTFAMIRSFGCFRGDTLSDGDLMRALCRARNPEDGPNILNGLAWYAGEEVARAYCGAFDPQ